MKLIVGLGNPTDKYKNNRHNVGFMVIDALINDLLASKITKKAFQGELFKYKDFLFLKPLTYMNLSGQSVVSVCNYFKIKTKDVIVIHDELDLEFGKIKLKQGGGNAGHNGLKSIDQHCGNSYIRVRIGIGKPKNKDVISHVLSDFGKDEQECLQKIIQKSVFLIKELFYKDLAEVQNSFSSKKSIC